MSRSIKKSTLHPDAESNPSCVQTHLLFQYGKIRDEPPTLQYIMGHADISVTLNTYTHVKFDDAKDELLRVANA